MTQPAPLDQVLAALGDPYRRRAVDLLGERPHRAGELATALGLAPSLMSRHLRVLRDTGLVAESHPHYDARVRIYELRPEALAGLRRWLADTEQLWATQLAAFQRHLEGGGDHRALEDSGGTEGTGHP